MLNVRRLTGLTNLSLAGFPNLVGDAPVAALATSLPPNLAILQLAGLRELEVGLIDCAEVCSRDGGHTVIICIGAMCCAESALAVTDRSTRLHWSRTE
jgi:hypothetical protein